MVAWLSAFVGTGGLEYLFGRVVASDDHAPEYHQRWALDGAQERDMFEAFVDEIMDRWRRFPDLHVYHYAPYEPGAIKRLMGRYATREDEVDRMLRAGVFVDLYSITKQALRASVERYSIKDLEQFFGYQRQIELREASMNLRAFERTLELHQVDVVPQPVRVAVQAYNRDDCVSTLRLRDWLEGLRAGLVEGGEDVPRPVPRDAEPSEEVDERQQQVLALMQQLLRDVPVDREERSEEEHARWLLAHMLGWHRREGKVPWWEYFRLAELDEEELMDERAGVAGLEFVEPAGGTAKCPIHRYRFPSQDTAVRDEDELHTGVDAKFGKVVGIDLTGRTVDIKKRGDTADLHPSAAFAHSTVGTTVLSDSLFRLGEWVAAHGVNAHGPLRAGRDLLLGLVPRCLGPAQPGAALQRTGETALEAARRLALELDGGVLAIQGPPGAGKTFTGARMICELVRAGKKVGITAGGHKVIRNLLEAVVEAAAQEGLSIRCLQKVKGKAAKDEGQPIRETAKNQDLDAALADGTVDVAAGTAWLWSREAAAESLDVLFVDEAGQMSLANVLAVSQAAHSVVLLGDPQQLEQPLQGTHPEGTDVSALEHLLRGKQTIAADRGLFLAETYRLHPSICQLTSELSYEGRLTSRPELAQQALLGDTPFAGAGLWTVAVAHDGNRNSSSEEVEAVAEIYEGLLSGDVSWRNQDGVEAKLTAADILIVAPYNAHVGLLGERLPGAKIGTVDKFQGQEAPVVIYSMATSSPDEAPRGMEFLFSLHRLNVATSRARCACILVASPRLFEPDCRTPRQMQLANAFCRCAELATTVE
ncbi:MAG: TM0106 family RecB-like putative nuclease [Nannocystales bacterium]